MTSYEATGKLLEGFHPQIGNTLEIASREWNSSKKFDLILMNPPFKGYESQTAQERHMVAQVLDDLAKGRTDVSLAFVKTAFDRLPEDGYLGIVLPASFLESASARPIRKLLSQNGDIQVLAKFDRYDIFPRGETRIVLMLFRRQTSMHSTFPTKVLYCRRSPDLAIRALETERPDTTYEWEIFVADSAEWGADWPLIPKQIKRILDDLGNQHPRLYDIFDIRQGVRIGNKHVLLIQNYQDFPKNERSLLKPLVDDENLYDWTIHPDNRRLIYAYENGKILTEHRLRKMYPKIFAHLKSFESVLQRRKMRRKEIWALAAPRDSKLMFRSKIVCANFGLAGNYAFDETGEFAVTNGSFLIPRNMFKAEAAWYYYLAVLNSDLFLRLVARRSRKLKGGQFDFDRRFTKDIPVPVYDQAPERIRKEVSKIGYTVHAKGLAALDPKKFEELVLAAYQLGVGDAALI
jgi:hypothetical protein